MFTRWLKLLFYLMLLSESRRPSQGTKCDVRDGQDVKDLVAFAQRELKYIDIWVLMLDLFLFVTLFV